ncbi:MAG: ComF family protein [Candidatus Daviesbacteria bacterium]|nr:ComF family protein [Candidatus Daviesbacteria bacterium]
MNLVLDLLFPKRCVGCRKLDTYFCKDCIANILQTDLVCPKCEKLAVGGQTHPICKRRYGLDGLWSLGIYQGSLREAIKQLKYGKVTGLSETLVDIMVEYWAKYQPFILDQIKASRGAGWAAIPVPLHWWRGNDRGFNQSSLIGQTLSKSLGLVCCDGLKRTRYTKPQVKLKGYGRHQNIREAFAVSSDVPISKSPNILLVDDVWTTGSTLRECCYALKRAGAKKVWAITLAR